MWCQNCYPVGSYEKRKIIGAKSGRVGGKLEVVMGNEQFTIERRILFALFQDTPFLVIPQPLQNVAS